MEHNRLRPNTYTELAILPVGQIQDNVCENQTKTLTLIGAEGGPSLMALLNHIRLD